VEADLVVAPASGGRSRGCAVQLADKVVGRVVFAELTLTMPSPREPPQAAAPFRHSFGPSAAPAPAFESRLLVARPQHARPTRNEGAPSGSRIRVRAAAAWAVTPAGSAARGLTGTEEKRRKEENYSMVDLGPADGLGFGLGKLGGRVEYRHFFPATKESAERAAFHVSQHERSR
jgi:hypothetical protein